MQTLHEIHASLQEFMVVNLLLRPALEDAINDMPLNTTKLAIFQVSVVNCFGNQQDFLVPNSEGTAERLERAVVAFMPKAIGPVHIERDCSRMTISLLSKSKF